MPCHSIGHTRYRDWACIHSHPQAERWADENLRRAGYTTFLPLEMMRRRDRAVSTMWHDVKVPLFPGYLFIRFDARSASWSPIRATPGVHDILRNGSQVLYAPNRAIENLMVRTSERGVVDDPGDRQGVMIDPGASVAVTQGPFAGMAGICRLSRGDRIRVMLSMLGGQREVELPTGHVEAV